MRHYFILALLLFLTGCSSYTPIAKIPKRYPPVASATLVQAVPSGAQYIGNLKIVPTDANLSLNEKRATKSLLKKAAKYGARYVYIVHSEKTNYDFWRLGWEQGDGVSIEAELFR